MFISIVYTAYYMLWSLNQMGMTFWVSLNIAWNDSAQHHEFCHRHIIDDAMVDDPRSLINFQRGDPRAVSLL
jgi:hypothetical protein